MAWRDYPLTQRMRWATTKRNRYWSDPDYRLGRINEQRRLRGRPEIASLAELGPRIVASPNERRDERGRFA